MKELFSAFGAAVFYPLVAVALPGLTAISGWFFYLVQRSPINILVSRNHSETALVLMLLAIFVGNVIDDLGMRLESAWLDPGRDRRTGGRHSQEWWAYLRRPFLTEPSGRRHLRRLVARLKFELGVPIGAAITGPAIWINPALPEQWAVVISGIALCVSFYLLYEAAATHEVLGRLRHELLKEEGTVFALAPRKTVQSA
jgi:hypothetical protein